MSWWWLVVAFIVGFAVGSPSFDALEIFVYRGGTQICERNVELDDLERNMQRLSCGELEIRMRSVD